jgi:hypothetical protein
MNKFELSAAFDTAQATFLGLDDLDGEKLESTCKTLLGDVLFPNLLILVFKVSHSSFKGWNILFQ